MSSKQALERATEEFAAFKLLPGRTRSYAEKLGLTWFWAYKIRSRKLALNHVRNSPLRALLHSAGNPVLPDLPGVSVGFPTTNNMAAAIADDRPMYSVGIDQLFRAPQLTFALHSASVASGGKRALAAGLMYVRNTVPSAARGRSQTPGADDL